MSNKQTAVLVVRSHKGDVWIVGTDTRRGFTEDGARKALEQVRFDIPFGWEAYWTNLEPFNFVLDSCKKLSHRHVT